MDNKQLAGGLGALALVALLTACGGGGGGGPLPPGGGGGGSNPTPTPTLSPTPIPSAALNGTLKDDGGANISGAAVALAPLQTPDPGGAPTGAQPTMAPAIASTTTASDGTYSFAGITPGQYVLSAVPTDASAVTNPTPNPPTLDPANNDQGTPTSTHTSLHIAVTLAGGANSRTDTLLRITDNELICDQEFEHNRVNLGQPTVPIDNEVLKEARADAAAAATAHGAFTNAPYGGIGRNNPQVWNQYNAGATCADKGFSGTAIGGNAGLSFAALTLLNDSINSGPYTAADFAIYP